jgi:hypothetical protein
MIFNGLMGRFGPPPTKGIVVDEGRGVVKRAKDVMKAAAGLEARDKCHFAITPCMLANP